MKRLFEQIIIRLQLRESWLISLPRHYNDDISISAHIQQADHAVGTTTAVSLFDLRLGGFHCRHLLMIASRHENKPTDEKKSHEQRCSTVAIIRFSTQRSYFLLRTPIIEKKPGGALSAIQLFMRCSGVYCTSWTFSEVSVSGNNRN
jgi:hypothetical protein